MSSEENKHQAKKFDTIEEAEKFIEDIKNGSELDAVICISGRTENSIDSISIKTLAEKIGTHKTAELLYKLSNSSECNSFGFTKEDMLKIMEKGQINPDSLTQDERIMYDFVNSNIDKHNATRELLEIMFSMFSTIGGIYNTIGGVFSFILTLCEILLTETSDNEMIKNMASSKSLRNSVIEKAVQELEEGGGDSLNYELKAIARMFQFGTSVMIQEYAGTKIDYGEIADKNGLDKKFILESANEFEAYKKEHEDTKSNEVPEESSITDFAKHTKNLLDSGKNSSSENKGSIRDRMKKRQS